MVTDRTGLHGRLGYLGGRRVAAVRRLGGRARAARGRGGRGRGGGRRPGTLARDGGPRLAARVRHAAPVLVPAATDTRIQTTNDTRAEACLKDELISPALHSPTKYITITRALVGNTIRQGSYTDGDSKTRRNAIRHISGFCNDWAECHQKKKYEYIPWR